MIHLLRGILKKKIFFFKYPKSENIRVSDSKNARMRETIWITGALDNRVSPALQNFYSCKTKISKSVWCKD